MTVYNLIVLLFGSGILTAFGKYLISRMKHNDERTEAVCYGVQALLRDRLYQSYDYYMGKGYAPIHAKENFENMYRQYHNLGLNGVMDKHYIDFMKLPDKPAEESRGE